MSRWASRRGLSQRLPHSLQVVLANFLLVAVATPLFFGPADDAGFAARNLAVGQTLFPLVPLQHLWHGVWRVMLKVLVRLRPELLPVPA